jgi:hypothetical protein
MAVCSSVDTEQLRPSYDTRWHDNRPASLPGRMLTIESAYRETGVDVSIDPNVAVIDDSAPQFGNWIVAELHDARTVRVKNLSYVTLTDTDKSFQF